MKDVTNSEPLAPVTIEVEESQYYFPNPISVELGCKGMSCSNDVITFTVKVKALEMEKRIKEES